MGNSATPASQIISLPQGGGALHGIGEKFSPDLYTGTGNFTVPLALPPGRNGFQPGVSLVYSTGNGNGPFGLGWSLSIPGVSRKTSKGLPLYSDGMDTFLLSGIEDLVPVLAGTNGTTRYRPRTENLFAQISHHNASEGNYWEVRSKDGLVSLYGRPRPAGANQTWRDSAAIVDPNDSAHTFAWKLIRTTDPFGNRIEYLYDKDPVQSDGPHRWDQSYLAEIRYIDYGDPALPQFLVTIHFTYENRPDHFSDYRAGFEIRTVQRCTGIDVYTSAGAEVLTRTYHLIYLDQREFTSEQLAYNGVSLLSQIKVEGHDGSALERLPPLEFCYSQFEPEKRRFSPVTGPDMPPGSLAHPEYELVDLLGNGLPAILEMNGIVRYWLNRGGGNFELPRDMPTAPAGLGLADKGVQLIDANGDGRLDLLVTTGNLAGYYPLRFDGKWDQHSFQPYKVAPSFDLKDPEVRLVDLDGDGITDAIRSGSRLECFFNDRLKGWTTENTRWVERQALEIFPDVNFSDTRVRWADMTGDGLQDISLIYNGHIEYWPNLGRGKWGKRISMRNSPRFPYGYNPNRILLGDVDGDGLADLVYVDDNQVTLWINQSGNGWSEHPLIVQGTPPVTDMDAVRLVDLFGSGISGVLWSADASERSRANMFFLDFTGGNKPYVLNEMDNHMGAVTKVEYTPSTHFYIEDEKLPQKHWKTPLPFPVQVVARVEVIDVFSRGKLTTEYHYHHGYWDGVEREFRGFGMVEQLDTESFEDYHSQGLHGERIDFAPVKPEQFSPPTLTKTWFHQGPIGDEFGTWEETDFSDEFWSGDPQVLSRPQSIQNFLKDLVHHVKRDALRTLRGRILRTELYALDGTSRQDRPYTVTEHLYGLREESPPGPGEAGDDRLHIFFPYTLAERTTQWERGDEPMTRFIFRGDYDTYGQPFAQGSVAIPRGRDFRLAAAPGEPYLATLTHRTYAQRDDEQRYIVDRVARTTTCEISNDGSLALFDLWEDIKNGSAPRNIIGQTLNYYDRDSSQPAHGPFVGLSFGKIGDYGALVRTERLVLTADILHEAYKSGSTVLTPAEVPPYFVHNGSPIWMAEYPQEFRDLLPPMAGYTYQPGGADPAYATGCFAATERRSYDFHADPAGKGRGLVTVKRDPLGHDTAITYDSYDLLPGKVTDSIGLSMQATYNYRVLQPSEVTDVNDNSTHYAFSPLGLVQSIEMVGKQGKEQGDTPEQLGTRFIYGFMAFDKSPVDNRQPVFVHTIKREEHRWDLIHEENARRQQQGQPPLSEADIQAMFPTDEVSKFPERFIQSREFSDGFGRLLQTRTQAEDVVFDDSALAQPVFGDAGLPAEQVSAPGDAVGHQASETFPFVAVSGWQTYDNKGQVVEKYEPFFSIGWTYAPPLDAQLGQKVAIYYDPRGQVIRSVNPDGSEQRVIYGVPADLTNPEPYTPTPWEAYTYDANDNAGRTHPDTSLLYQKHWNTPSNIVVDALGRTVQAVGRNGANPGTDWYVTRSTYDIRGNVLCVIDSLSRIALQYTYDLGNRPLRVEQLDAGIRRTVLDALGNTVEQRDSKGTLMLYAYDLLNRPVRLWARDDDGSSVTLRERLEYGDGGYPLQPDAERNANRQANRLGKLYRHYDEAGLLIHSSYDFKANILDKVRQVINDVSILAVFNPAPHDWVVQAFRVDWQPQGGTTLEQYAATLLDPAQFTTSLAYDALNRIKSMQYPQDADGPSKRKMLLPSYDRAGALERVELDSKTYLERIAYNAKGQRILLAYGNGIMTRYAYDRKTFRLLRMRTEHYTTPAAFTYHPAGMPLQDITYTYDLVGNILTIQDHTPGCGVLNNPEVGKVTDSQLAQLLVKGDVLLRHFDYDPLYRLLSATGRECGDIPSPRPWTDDQRCGFNSGQQGTPNQDNAPQLTTIYQEEYSYDPEGNMLTLKHDNYNTQSHNNTSWTQYFGMGGLTPEQWDQVWHNHLVVNGVWANPPGNTLTYTGNDPSATSQTHQYDTNGNLIQETTSRSFEWDQNDRMRAYRTQVGKAEPSVYVHYLYDASGQRVKKLVRTQGGRYEVTVYIDGVFELHLWKEVGGTVKQNNHIHVMDNLQRIALLRVGDKHSDDKGPAVQYHLGDHLGSSSTVIDDVGYWIGREEYFPYGQTSLGSFARKRYRFIGKERDEESGLYYHGARHYAPWLARWVSCDPAGMVDGANLFVAFKNSPLRYVDLRGNETTDVGTPAGGMPVSGTEGTGVGQADAGTFIKDEIAGYQQQRSSSIVGPSGQAGPAPSIQKTRRTERNDAGQNKLQMDPSKEVTQGQLDPTKNLSQARIPDAGQPPATGYTLGIAINVSSHSKGYVNVGENPGHSVVYTQNPRGEKQVLSFGPSLPVERHSYEFLNDRLPATPTYHLDAKDPYNLYTWSITESQYANARTFMQNIKADAGVYSIDRQCTSMAIDAARAAGLDVPPGLGKLDIPLYPGTPITSTPYHLDKELQEQGQQPTQIEPQVFEPYLEIR